MPGQVVVGRDREIAAVAAALAEPGLVLLTGTAGIGRTAVAREAAGRLGRRVHAGGGLVTLRLVPYLPLARAIRARLPAGDAPLAVEAVRARVGGGLVLLDDLQWADPATLVLLPRLAEYVRVLAVARTPAPLVDLAPLVEAARRSVDLGPLEESDAAALVRHLGGDPARLVPRGQGNPAVLSALARATGWPDSLAGLVAELPQAERTALAALGLLGRPAPAPLLGSGLRGLRERGLVRPAGGGWEPAERMVAEVAAGVLAPRARATMHARLAELTTDDGEAAVHLAAAGDPSGAAEAARRAAARAVGLDDRAAYLHLAAEQSGDEATRVAAATAALDAGRPEAAGRLLGSAPAPALRERLAVWTAPLAPGDDADRRMARLRADGDRVGELQLGARAVAGLRDRLRTAEALNLATELARRSAEVGAYGWEVTFRVEALWAALLGQGALEAALTDGARLAERSRPDSAGVLLAVTLAIARADSGGLRTARLALEPAAGTRLGRWAAGELDLLDGDPAAAAARVGGLVDRTDLAGQLGALTRLWSGRPAVAPPGSAHPVEAAISGDYETAARGWEHVLVRERVRCLIAADGVDGLLEGERTAERTGLVLLLARVRQALRAHGVRHAAGPAEPADAPVSPREYEVLSLVGAGLSSRRIAERLGLSTSTVETYIRSAMGKVGARTRTEAAVRIGGG